MNQAGFDELAALLQRADILFACQEGPVDRTTICERVDCSRATAYRATADLEERGYIEKHDGGYRLTVIGKGVVENIRHFQSGTSGARNIAPVLEHVDAAGLIDAAHVFRDAEVFEATPSMPYLLEQRLLSIIGETDTLLMAATNSSSSAAMATWSRTLVGPHVDVSHAITSEALEDVQAQDRAVHGERANIDEREMYLADEISLDLMVFDDTLVVPGPDDKTGVLASMVITDNPKAVVWACAHIARHCDNGEPLAQ